MVLRVIKSPFSIIFLMMIIVLLSHSSFYEPITRFVKTRQLNAQPDTRSKSLVKILRKVAMPDRRVVVSMFGEEWASPDSILDLFLESFRIGQGTKPLLNHLLIVASDTKAFHYCNSIHPHCFYLTLKYFSKKPLPLPYLKYKFFHELIKLGYNFIFTDADVMWLRNPLSQIDPGKELTIACHYSGDLPSITNVEDGGFFHMRSNENTLEYFKYWNVAMVVNPYYQNQSLCEASVSDNIFDRLSMNVKYLEMARFGEFCQERGKMKEICTVRANCCENIEDKVHDLKLLLDDWRNFTAPSAENTSSKDSSFRWRAPEKCKGMKISS